MNGVPSSIVTMCREVSTLLRRRIERHQESLTVPGVGISQSQSPLSDTVQAPQGIPYQQNPGVPGGVPHSHGISHSHGITDPYSIFPIGTDWLYTLWGRYTKLAFSRGASGAYDDDRKRLRVLRSVTSPTSEEVHMGGREEFLRSLLSGYDTFELVLSAVLESRRLSESPDRVGEVVKRSLCRAYYTGRQSAIFKISQEAYDAEGT